MSKCSNCGCEIASGMKFCGECGTPVPQTKKCPKCGAEFPLAMKFCGECGYSFSGAGASASSMIGDKNVIAGDVNVSNTTTNYINQDATKQVVKCAVCGRTVVITKAFQCPECGEYVCADHYDIESRMCTSCHSAKVDGAESEYRKALETILEDGIVDQDEFEQLEQLRKKLGISAPRAMELQKQMKAEAVAKKGAASSDVPLMIVEQAQCERAKNVLYGDGDFKEAFNLIQSIYRNHPLNEEVLSVYLAALSGIDEKKVRSVVGALPVDYACAYLALVDLEVKSGDLAAAEAKLAEAEKLWHDNRFVQYRRVLLMYATAAQLKERAYLAEAMDMLTSLPEAKEKLDVSWQFYLQYVISKYLGDEVPALTAEFCKSEGVYHAFVNGVLLGLKDGDSVQVCSDAKSILAKASALYGEKKYREALPLLENAARAGDKKAMEWLADMYHEGNGVPTNWGNEVRWLEELANEGVFEAYYKIAKLHADGGPGLAQDNVKALNYMRLSAAKGNGAAARELGDWSFYGRVGQDVDFAEALVYYKKAAEAGSGDAMYMIGEMFRDGCGVVADSGQAHDWFKKASDAGCRDAEKACLKLPKTNDISEGEAEKLVNEGKRALEEKKDLAKAIQLFKRAAGAGNGCALHALATIYRCGGDAIEENSKDKWILFMKLAADAGEKEAANELAVAYKTGKDIEQDDNQYRKYAIRAAELGDAMYQVLVGVWFQQGLEGQEQNEEKAFHWFEKAAEQGDKNAMMFIALAYGAGTGIGQDDRMSRTWFEKAFKAGSAEAASKLGEIYLEGDGVEVDEQKGVEYIKKAAEMGDADALTKVGLWYDEGQYGFREDDALAVKYYQKAADQDDPCAMYNLGMMYLFGEGISKDVDVAVSWLKKAAESGHEEAKNTLEKLNGE